MQVITLGQKYTNTPVNNGINPPPPPNGSARGQFLAITRSHGELATSIILQHRLARMQ